MKQIELVNYVKGLIGQSVDVDGLYGAQCVDLIKHIFSKFFGYMPYGNAIDYANNTMPQGFKRYLKIQAKPQPGDILVWKWSDADVYGHIGVCVAVDGDYVTSVEQNVDGTPDKGGPCRYRTRTTECLVAILRPPFDVEAGWVKNNVGWWYRNSDNSYPKLEWKKIDNEWYYFNAKGYAVVGWQLINKKWYYFDSDCKMQTGWIKYKDKWYYIKASGEMVSEEFRKVDGKWYRFGANGEMFEKTALYVGENGVIR